MNSVSSHDRKWMRRAIALARRGEGHTRPNPPVGAVVVYGTGKLGEGFHRRAGEAHAEVVALDACRGAARGATLYVTLEPCSTQGRTPPCTDRILSEGIARVVVGCCDETGCHRGRGLESWPRTGRGGLRRLRRRSTRVGACFSSTSPRDCRM